MSINHDPRKVQSSPAWHNALRCGDIVGFRFPVEGNARHEVPDVRPCLVLDIVRRGDQAYALLAYGSAAKTHTGRSYETSVSRRRELRKAGLEEPLRFIGATRLLVPLGHRGFAMGSNGSPIMGRLTGSAEQRMNAVRTRIIAEQDMAASRRAAKRRARGKRHDRQQSNMPAADQTQRSFNA